MLFFKYFANFIASHGSKTKLLETSLLIKCAEKPATPAIIGNNAPPVAAVPAANAAVPPVAAVPVATAPAAAFPPPIFNKLPTALNIPPASFLPTPFSLNDNKFVTCFAASLAINDNKVFNNAL